MKTQAGLIDRPNDSKSYRSQCFAISGTAQVSISKQNTSDFKMRAEEVWHEYW